MSKIIKQMEMADMRHTLQDVRDLVVLSISGLSSQADYGLRAALRKKKIRLKMVKNSLAQRVFGELGLNAGDGPAIWAGPTVLAWGAGSIAELSRDLDGELKQPKTAALYKDKVKVKGAVADGQPVPFDIALKMPTRTEAIAQILQTILSPGAQIAGCLTGPAAQVASQIQTLSEKKEEEAPAAAEEAPAAAPAG